MSADERARLIKMEETLHNRVIGQEEAVVAISRAIRRARVGLKSPNRPIASFIFSGAPSLPSVFCLSVRGVSRTLSAQRRPVQAILAPLMAQHVPGEQLPAVICAPAC